MTRYTCAEYRQEMILSGLRRQLQQSDLSEKERQALIERIRQLEAEMGMD